MPTSTSSDEEVDEVYETLTAIQEKKKAGYQLICGGDFNGEVGNRSFGNEETVGPFGPNKRNGRGIKLVEWCQEQGLSIANTWTQQKNKTTWVHPRDGT
jgi:hypothetical protein